MDFKCIESSFFNKIEMHAVQIEKIINLKMGIILTEDFYIY